MTQTVRLTYRELGDRLGVSFHAARMLARRRMWPVVRGNDRVARVTVEESELASEAERLAERSAARASEDQEHVHQHDQVNVHQHDGVVHRLHVQLDAAEREVAFLRGQVAELRVEVVQAHADRDVARAEIAATAAAATARFDAQERLVVELHEALAWHRLPWWRRWRG